jgi:hypothetical protein
MKRASSAVNSAERITSSLFVKEKLQEYALIAEIVGGVALIVCVASSSFIA